MSAKTLFDNACKTTPSDTADKTALYASYLKSLKFIQPNLYKGLIFLNRYLKADYTDEATFLYN